jgi:hypothetical protein
MDTAQKIREWRAKTAAGQELSIEEMREVIQLLRADRKMSVVVQEVKKVRASPKNAKALLDNFSAQMTGTEE